MWQNFVTDVSFIVLQQQLFYDHYVGQPVIAGTLVENRQILTARLPLLMATIAFWLGKRC